MSSTDPNAARPEEFFDFLLEHIPDQVYFKDRHGRFLRASRAVADYMNVANPKDLIGKSDFDFWSSETAKNTADDEQRIMATKTPLVGKIEKLIHPDGRITWDYTTKMPLLNSRGEVIGICGINRDFTAMKEMQDALAEERNRLKATTEELEAKNAALQADLQLAREVQEALLPRDTRRLRVSAFRGRTLFPLHIIIFPQPRSEAISLTSLLSLKPALVF